MNIPTYITGSTQTKAYRLLREHVRAVLSEYDLTPTHWSMLGIVMQSKSGVRQVDIATNLHVKAPLVTTMAQSLEERGIIQSVQNQFDARAKLLALTPRGKKFMKNVDDALHEVLKKLLKGITEGELEVYNKVLTTVIANDAALKQPR
jgi:DNA-binding MarR family transcriptional regulator